METIERNFNIHECCYNGNLEAMKKHFKIYGNDSFIKLVNKKSLGGLTPLHIASFKKNRTCAEFLLRHGANANNKDSSGKIPLHYACENSYPIDLELIVLLIDYRSDLYEKDNENRCSLDYFCEVREREIKNSEDNNMIKNTNYKFKALSCGFNSNWQLGFENSENISQPLGIHGLGKNVSVISTSQYHSAVISDNKLFVCGKGEKGVLCSNNNVFRSFQEVSGYESITFVTVSNKMTAFINQRGYLYTCGESGALGYDTNLPYITQPRRVKGQLENKVVTKIFLSNFHSVVIAEKSLYTFGRGKQGQLGHESFTDESEPRLVIYASKLKISHIIAQDEYTAIFSKQKGKYFTNIAIFGFSKTTANKLVSSQIVSSASKTFPSQNNDQNQFQFAQAYGSSNFMIFITECGKACVLFKLNDIDPKKKLNMKWVSEMNNYNIVKCSVFEKVAHFVSLCGEIFQVTLDMKGNSSSKFLTALEQVPLKICSSKSHYMVLTSSRLPKKRTVTTSQVYEKENSSLNSSIESPLFNTISFKIGEKFLYSHHLFLSPYPLFLKYVEENSEKSSNGLKNVLVDFEVSYDAFKSFLLLFYGNSIDLSFLTPIEKSEIFNLANKFGAENLLKERSKGMQSRQKNYETHKSFNDFCYYEPSVLSESTSFLFHDNCVVDKKTKKNESYFRKSENNIGVHMPYTDLEITSQDPKYSIKVHKLIFSRCPFFKVTLNSGMKEAENSKIDLNYVEPLILFHIVRYLYTYSFDPNQYGTDKFDLNFSAQLIFLSDQLMLPGLKLLCENFIIKNMDYRSVVKCLEVSHYSRSLFLQKNCLRFIYKNLDLIMPLYTFNQLDSFIFSLINDYIKKKHKGINNNNHFPIFSNFSSNITNMSTEVLPKGKKLKSKFYEVLILEELQKRNTKLTSEELSKLEMKPSIVDALINISHADPFELEDWFLNQKLNTEIPKYISTRNTDPKLNKSTKIK
eukprot:TRINITY_DN6640_c0_g1_i2.p1 TRINITY_DN6640_c0_g1~~TRINITY_DN6640_c0_g1_i2.p1  ORF type:complete len:971 (-),score=241.94 TRINITY_DN6640_c0_g1_i2:140-3052(-)